MKILVVEDEPIIGQGLVESLRGLGHTTAGPVPSGNEAVECAVEAGVELVLMDIFLSGSMDGIEAARRIRERIDVPVVFVSAYSDDATLQRAIASGPYGYLIKPYSENELDAAILVAKERHSAHRAQVAAARLEALQRVFDATPTGLVVTDERGEIVRFNREAERIFGYATAEIEGRSIEILVPPELRETHATLRAGYQADPEIRKMGAGRELFGMRRDGSPVPVEIGLAPLDSEHELVLSTIVDITARRAAEEQLFEHARLLDVKNEQLASALSQLEVRNRELDAFASIISHDLKAPLRHISTLAAWILEESGASLTADSRENLEHLLGSAARMKTMIDGVLAYSRAALEPAEYSDVDTRILVRDLVATLRLPGAARIELEDDLPAVLWDETRLGQIFQNLISNALAHVDPDSGWVRVSFAHEERGPTFRVTDNGPGIAPQFHDLVFEIFQTLPSSEKKGGTGVGLAVVKKLVEGRGGQIWIESDVGRGASFAFTVPRGALTRRGEHDEVPD